jgi:hypothetical protein
VEQEAAAARDARRIDRETDPRRRLEAQRYIDRAKIAVVKRQHRLQTHAVDRRAHRTDARARGEARFDTDARLGRRQADVQRIDAQRADRQVQREVDVGRCRAFEAHATRCRPAHAEIELQLDAVGRKDRRQERIRVARLDRGAAAFDFCTEARRQLAACRFDAARERDRIGIEHAATGERQQRDAPVRRCG